MYVSIRVNTSRRKYYFRIVKENIKYRQIPFCKNLLNSEHERNSICQDSAGSMEQKSNVINYDIFNY